MLIQAHFTWAFGSGGRFKSRCTNRQAEMDAKLCSHKGKKTSIPWESLVFENQQHCRRLRWKDTSALEKSSACWFHLFQRCGTSSCFFLHLPLVENLLQFRRNKNYNVLLPLFTLFDTTLKCLRPFEKWTHNRTRNWCKFSFVLFNVGVSNYAYQKCVKH